MLRHLLTLSGLFFALQPSASFAQLENGDLESWTDNTPASWNIIDTGITVIPTSNYVYSGNTSAQVTVTTGNQSATDFRQTISVQSGQQYTFSTWLYHTEGSLAARFYVDGYHNYSNEALTGQWQQLSYTYTASFSGQIEVGLRFYDRTGFDGSETVYIDNFMPSSSSSSCSSHAGSFELNTDNYGGETSWEIIDDNGATQVAGSGYDSNSSYNEAVCLSEGSYTLVVSDTYGDGLCCNYGNGSYTLIIDGDTMASGGQFGATDTSSFELGSGSGSSGGGSGDLDAYYDSAEGLSGYSLKSALYDVIKDHSTQSYSDLWTFYSAYGRDSHYDNDATILDIYSENPAGTDAYTFTSGSDQCGSYGGEGDCYNREHSFPRAWFGGSIAPMNTDIHHIFATDGYVNGRRSSYPYGEVSATTYLSDNGSRLGSGVPSQGYTGTVFEPIDEFKGDIARAYFYMATRYENVIGGWQNNSSYGDAVLDGSSDQVFEDWVLNVLLQWHSNDPVSQYETDRNEAAYSFQGNRNPFIDHPELVNEIWGS